MVGKRLFTVKMGMISALLMVTGMVVAGCAPVAFTTAGPGRPATAERDAASGKPQINIAELEQRIHELINQERANNGLSRLAWNSTLSTIARRHSQDMVKRNYFGHYSPEGQDLAYRYARQGFVCEVDAGAVYYTGAENIFQNSLYDTLEYVNEIPAAYRWTDMETIAESTVKGWMSSPGHRKNILEPSWRTEGIGIAISNDHKVYITDDYC